METKHCPCCSNENYLDCCGRFIMQKQVPATPEELMRSRYTAYALANMDYIEKTMKPPASNNFNKRDASKRAKKIKWVKLEVLNTSGIELNKGFVEFIAYFYDKKLKAIHELSEFHQDNGQWYYVDGKYLRQGEVK